jgi:hypothetical protein
MDAICNFVTHNTSNKKYFSTIQNKYKPIKYLDILDEMCDDLFENFDEIRIVYLYPENVGEQYKTLISFIYKGYICEIGEYFTIYNDYFYVEISENKWLND